MFLINKSINSYFKLVGKILFVSGIISLLLILLFKFIINILVGYRYKLFVDVISESICSGLLYRGIISLLLGIILLVIYKVIRDKNIKENS